MLASEAVQERPVPAAERVDPRRLFSDQEWASLSQRSAWRGLLLVVHAWVVILLAGALFVLWPNPLTLILAVMLIGARQLGLAILMHDAAHAALHSDLRVNDGVAHWLCGAPVGADLGRYRPYHLSHHKFAQQPEDPDLPLSAPFPITLGSLGRKAVRDLTGQTFYKQRIAPTVAAIRTRRARKLRRRDVAIALWAFWGPFLIMNGLAIVVLALVGLWWVWPVLWLLPMATWYPLVTRVRNIAEHAVTPDNNDPLRHARTTRANLIERALIAPYVNYHCEHHMFMHLPCWRLPRAHRLLTRKGVTARMEVQPGYLSVLKLATSAESDHTRGGGRTAPAQPVAAFG
jgi:fatty acid desaturase